MSYLEYIDDEICNSFYNQEINTFKPLKKSHMNISKKAFYVSAKIDGQSWKNYSVVVTAPNSEAAIIKAMDIIPITPEHTITYQNVEVFNTGAILETDKYPYGRLVSTAYFSVDSNKKGMRTTFQTINPKNGRLNKPKHSTYYQAILPMKKENGHYEYCGYLDFNGTEAINRGLQFMSDLYELFGDEEIKRIAAYALAMSKINTQAMVAFAGSNFEDIKPLIEKSVNTLIEICNTGQNLFEQCKIDLKAMEATKKPNYNPFNK